MPASAFACIYALIPTLVPRIPDKLGDIFPAQQKNE